MLAHPEKEGATATWKQTFRLDPLLAFLDHGPGGTGECVGGLLRSGKTTANNTSDHIAVLTDALAQLPVEQRSRVLVRGDSGAGVHAFVHHIAAARVALQRRGSTPTSRSWTPSRCCLDKPGEPRSTATVSRAKGRRSPS